MSTSAEPYLSARLSAYLSARPSAYLSPICLLTYRPSVAYLSARPSAYLSAHLSVYLSTHLIKIKSSSTEEIIDYYYTSPVILLCSYFFQRRSLDILFNHFSTEVVVGSLSPAFYPPFFALFQSDLFRHVCHVAVSDDAMFDGVGYVRLLR